MAYTTTDMKMVHLRPIVMISLKFMSRCPFLASKALEKGQFWFSRNPSQHSGRKKIETLVWRVVDTFWRKLGEFKI